MTKLLCRLAEKEGLPLDPAAAAAMAEVSDGDVRNAVQTLQLLAGSMAATKAGAKPGSKKVKGV